MDLPFYRRSVIKTWPPYKKALKKAYSSIHDRFMNDEKYCVSQLTLHRTESIIYCSC